jgi:RimJ/RimL family protein N-acetyltransferase
MTRTVAGIKINLVEITENDASEIITLRNNPDLNQFLSSQSLISLESQIEWIKHNKERTDNVYFKIVDKDNVFKGTISLYRIENDRAEFGRFISINSIAAVEGEYLILKFAFESMKLNKVYCKTIKESQKVIQMHTKLGFKTVGLENNEELNKLLVIQEISRSDFESYDFRPILSLIEKI